MKNRGFTLMELLVVIAIIGVLSTLGFAAVNFARERAKTVKAQHDVDAIYTAISALANDTNLWPGPQTYDEVCSAGCARVSDLTINTAGIVLTDGTYPGWNGPYMNSIPNDPWNNTYFLDTRYQTDLDGKPCGPPPTVGCVDTAVIASLGPDGASADTGLDENNLDDVIKIIAK